uniref:Uncharacterized protein n=1 Tax=Timema bartmani TaxID=61472 RepID=A0A7R9EWA7_9NEOP|nr:unnamed protein product [Timema bartmani]
MYNGKSGNLLIKDTIFYLLCPLIINKRNLNLLNKSQNRKKLFTLKIIQGNYFIQFVMVLYQLQDESKFNEILCFL